MKKMIFLKVKNSYYKKLVTWLDLNLQVAQVYNFSSFILKFHFIAIINIFMSHLQIQIQPSN